MFKKFLAKKLLIGVIYNNKQVTITPIVIGAFGTVTKGLLKGQEDLEVGGDHPNDSINENG